MLKISRLADYGTVILRFLAIQSEVFWSASVIAEKVRIATPTVSKILKLLHEADLLISSRGSNGGYRLARPAEQISLAEVISAIDGVPAITRCSQTENVCVRNDVCDIRDQWRFVNRAILNVLKNLNIADMGRSLYELESRNKNLVDEDSLK